MSHTGMEGQEVCEEAAPGRGHRLASPGQQGQQGSCLAEAEEGPSCREHCLLNGVFCSGSLLVSKPFILGVS